MIQEGDRVVITGKELTKKFFGWVKGMNVSKFGTVVYLDAESAEIALDGDPTDIYWTFHLEDLEACNENYKAPTHLVVIIEDRTSVIADKIHLDHTYEPDRRLVTIELTPEQREKLILRSTGYLSGKKQFEKISTVFLENREE